MSATPETQAIELMKNQTPHQARIEEFMLKARQTVPNKPTIPDDKVCILRAKLIYEEAMETIRALGVSPVYVFKVEAAGVNIPPFQIDISKVSQKDIQFDKTGETDMVEVADGCADISVVTVGTLSAFGIHDDPILKAVDQNNLDKFGEGHSWRSDGKLQKPANHKKVDLQAVLDAQG